VVGTATGLTVAFFGRDGFQNPTDFTNELLYAYACSSLIDMHVDTYIVPAMSTRLPCYCATMRQATRVISQKYEAALRGTQLTITQYTLLLVLIEMPRPRVSDLAEALAMDQTTLSRTLKVMERDGVISSAPGEDQRESRWLITARGRARMRRALPRWQEAQCAVEKALGSAETESLASGAFNLATRLAAS
jgi:DNA-binding MarR family transcriptional regulator